MIKVELPAWSEDLWRPARYKVLYGGRGSAKSWTIATILIILATQRPLRVLCTRELQNSIDASNYKLLCDRIKDLGLGWFFEIQKTKIIGKNGSEFTFKGLKQNADSAKSMEGIDICWIEEAQSVSRESYSVIPATIRRDGSEIWISFNPRNSDDYVFQAFVKSHSEQGDIVRKVNWRDNPWFPKTLDDERLRDIKRGDMDFYNHVWEGECWSRTTARVFSNWRVDDFKTPADAEFLFGADWGFAVDPTVLVRLFIKDKTIFIDHEAYATGCEVVDTPELFSLVPGAQSHVIRADSARPEIISHMRRAGFNVVAADKGKGSVEAGVSFIRSYDVVIHPRCAKTIDEFSKYSYKLHRLTGDPLPELKPGFDHCVDAIRYAVAPLSLERPAPAVHFIRIGN